MNVQEATAAWQADQAHLAAHGVILPDVISYIPDGFKRDYTLAMDAQPTLMTAPNSAIPAFLTTMVDPDVFRVLFAPTKAAEILGETRKGTWLDETAMFPIVENVGEVSSYGDFNNNGHTGVNTNWTNRQSYLFQTVKEYGERELERAGLARINWVSEIDQAAARVLQRFLNQTYFFGILGLQNYGLLNDPNLGASLTPSTKAAGGVQWIKSGAINATANEVYADLQALFLQLVTQTQGLVDSDARLVLAMSPAAQVALTATNTYNVNVYDLLKKNFPNIRFETAVQYGGVSTTNPNGIAAGNLVQLLVEEIEGQKTGYAAFAEKLRNHPIVREMSSFKQKATSASWGAIIRMPVAIASMVGV